MTDVFQMSFEERAERVLDITFRGIHHCGKITKEPRMWSTNHYGDLSTFDFDVLTRLVFAAHDYGIRVSIRNSGPRMVKIVLHPRICRSGDFNDRHPDLNEAIENYRRGQPDPSTITPQPSPA